MFGFDDFLLMAGASIVGAGASSYLTRRNERSAFDDNAQLSWQMWNAQNEYNRPINQMARFREAGLNPNLFYGHVNTAAPISVPAQRGTPVNVDMSALMAQKLANMKVEQAQVRQNMALQRDITASNLAYQQAQIAGLLLSNKSQEAMLAYSAREGLPPQVVLSELQGGLGPMVFKVIKDRGLKGLIDMLRYSNDGSKPPSVGSRGVHPWNVGLQFPY